MARRKVVDEGTGGRRGLTTTEPALRNRKRVPLFPYISSPYARNAGSFRADEYNRVLLELALIFYKKLKNNILQIVTMHSNQHSPPIPRRTSLFLIKAILGNAAEEKR